MEQIMQSTHLDVYLSQNWSVPPMVQKVCRDLLGCRPSEKYYLNDRLGIDALVDERQELIQEIQPIVYNASVDDYLSLSFIFVILLAYALLILCVIAGCFGAKAKRFFKSRKFMLLWSTFTIIYYLRWLLPSSVVEGGFNSLYQQFPNIFEMDTRSLHELCHGNRSVDFVLTPKSPDESWPTHFSPIKSVQASNENNVRFIALHFPQWYADHVNGMMDDWRYFQNPNFTQNVNGVPIVRPRGHIYYDNRCRAVRRTQGQLAKRYGIDAFVYYIYFGSNVWLLNEVLGSLLNDGEPNIDFALMWPNEKFGGQEPRYDRPDLLADILAPFFECKSYLRVNGHPMFYIYLGNIVPEVFWNQLNDVLAVKYQLPSIHLVSCIQHLGYNLHPLAHARGYAEFPPNNFDHIWRFHGHYEWSRYPIELRPHQLGLTVHFDNTPRISGGDPAYLPDQLTKSRGVPDVPSTPEAFRTRCMERVKNWLMHHEDDKAKYPEILGNDTNPKIVLVFAWNEWSEQAALEPSDLYGYDYLEAMRDCIIFTRALEKRIAHSQVQ